MRVDGFEELGYRISELAERFESEATGVAGQGGQGRDPESGQFLSPESFEPKKRINVGIQKALDDIVDQGRAAASRHVPDEDARTVTSESFNWNRHRFGATSDLVKHHEYGTSTRASDPSRATVNAPNNDGYVIPLDGYDSLPFGPDAVDTMDSLNFRFVVHPGVEGKHFLRDTLEQNTWKIKRNIARELDKIEFIIDG